MNNSPKEGGAPGTTDQWPRWEGPEESRPPGYLPAKDDPNKDRDAAGENLQHPRKRDLGDANKTLSDSSSSVEDGYASAAVHDDDRHKRAYHIWENEGRPEGRDIDHWDSAGNFVEPGEATQDVDLSDMQLDRNAQARPLQPTAEDDTPSDATSGLNNRESGASKYPAKDRPDHSDQFAQGAATNKLPPLGVGLTEASANANEKMRHSDGQNPSHAAPVKSDR